MRSILAVVSAATSSQLTTLARVKQELGISDSDGSNDDLLDAKIEEASSDVEAFLGFRVPLETVTETFWQGPDREAPEFLILDRTPVASIVSVTVDGTAYDSSRYRLDTGAGLLYGLDVAGYPCPWLTWQSIVVQYSGGYILPGETNRDLPYAIEAGTVDLLTSFWLARGRDPAVKLEMIEGVGRTDYWVGAIGQDGELPPSVVAKLAPFRRAAA